MPPGGKSRKVYGGGYAVERGTCSWPDGGEQPPGQDTKVGYLRAGARWWAPPLPFWGHPQPPFLLGAPGSPVKADRTGRGVHVSQTGKMNDGVTQYLSSGRSWGGSGALSLGVARHAVTVVRLAVKLPWRVKTRIKTKKIKKNMFQLTLFLPSSTSKA